MLDNDYEYNICILFSTWNTCMHFSTWRRCPSPQAAPECRMYISLLSAAKLRKPITQTRELVYSQVYFTRWYLSRNWADGRHLDAANPSNADALIVRDAVQGRRPRNRCHSLQGRPAGQGRRPWHGSRHPPHLLCHGKWQKKVSIISMNAIYVLKHACKYKQSGDLWSCMLLNTDLLASCFIFESFLSTVHRCPEISVV